MAEHRGSAGPARSGDRPVQAVQLLLGDIRLAVLAAVTVLAVRTPNAVLAAVVTVLALPLVWYLRRPRPELRGRPTLGWALTGVDALLAVLVLAATGVDSLALIYVGVTCALAGLRHGVAGVVAVGVVVGVVHLWAVLASPDVSGDAVVVVLVRLGLVAVVGLATARVRDLLIGRARLEAEVRRLHDDRIRDLERRRLARDMHDSLAKTLHGCAMLAGRLARRLHRDDHPDAGDATVVVEALQQAQVEARQLLTDLREDVAGPLPHRLGGLVGDWGRRTGLAARLSAGDSVPLPAESEDELVRATAELLENVHRHAAAASAEVVLAAVGPDVVVEVRDDGQGMPAPDLAALSRDGHFGLVGVSERMARIGGRVEVLAGAGTGAVVRLTVPGGTDRVPPDESRAASWRGVVPPVTARRGRTT